MADRITAVLLDGTRVTTDQAIPAGDPLYTRVARVEIEREGSDQKLVVHTVPSRKDSYVKRSPIRPFGSDDIIQVRAPIPWCLSDEPEFWLDAFVRKGKLIKLHLGRGLAHEDRPGNLYNAWKNGTSFEILNKSFHFDDRKLKGLGKDLDFDAKGGLNASLTAIRKPDKDGDCKPSKELALVFEQMVSFKADSLNAFGAQDKVAERTVRLVQVPGPVACGDEGSARGQQTWYVGILGLPYLWGRNIWNSVLAEQIRVSELDIQHGSLFAPLLPATGNASHLWNLVYEVVNEVAGSSSKWSDSALSRSLELISLAEGTRAHAEFPLLRNHLGQSIEAELPLIGPPKQAGFEPVVESFLQAIRNPGLSIQLAKESTLAVTSADRSVRIGALDFTFAAAPGERKSQQPAYLRWHLTSSERPEPELQGKYEWNAADVAMDWAIESVSPGGQDDLAGEFYADCDPAVESRMPNHEKKEHALECMQRRERPLVVPLSSNHASGLVLSTQEQARRGAARRIDLALRRTDGGGAGRGESKDLAVCSQENGMDRVAVLDREPFVVAKVSFPALGSLEDPAADNEVANWQSYGSDAGAWHIRFPNAQSFCLTLPPQGVGETMEKRKQGHLGLDETERADLRLSPPAFLAMRETFFRQNFPEAPWNLRRLLSDSGRELPGAQLEHLQYELLYGLSCRIDYPFMRLAELSALAGDVVGPLPQTPAWVPLKKQGNLEIPDDAAVKLYDGARRRWAGTSRRTRQRLGVFELWDIRQLDTLELKDNVTCWIRYDDPSKAPEELVKVREAEIANPFLPMDDPKNRGKLKGGVTWGFESRNVYQAVVRDGPNGKWPRSNAAEMKDTRLSALGGYGHQTAAFDHWRTKILADVAMGRSYSYTLERIGRIGVWWNRAKHVIIYERTVVPSAQFGSLPQGDPDEQDILAGRAVLRKVEEYVEILQNSRKYPDRDKGDAKATGFVTECSFSDDPNKIVRFRVRSSWGSDIGNVGWKIPIWRPGEKRVDLYPKPVVHLTVMASVDGESVPRKVTIADPENLFFYTDTTVKPEALENPSVDLSNTDEWEPVESVDFVDQARPRPATDQAFAAGSLRQTGAGDTALPAGFRPCTFLIEPAEHTVDLLANRRGDPMGALLSSVTMCRADFQEVEPGLSAVVETARTLVTNKVKDHLDFLPAEASRLNVVDLKNRLATVCQTFGSDVGQALQGPTERLQEGNERLQQIGQSIDHLVQQLDEQATEKITTEARRLTAFPRDLVDKLKNQRQDLKDALQHEIDQARAQMALAPSPAAYLGSVEAALREAEQQLVEAENQLKEAATATADEWLAAARLPELIARLRSYRAALQSVSQRVRGLADCDSLRSGNQTLALGIGPQWVVKKLDLAKIAGLVDAAAAALASAERLAAGAQEAKALAKDRLTKLLAQHQAELAGEIAKLTGFLQTAQGKLSEAETKRRDRFKDFTEELLKVADAAIDSLAPDELLDKLRATWEAAVTSQAEALKKGINDDMAVIRAAAGQFFAGLDVKELIPSRQSVQTAVERQCSELKSRFDDLVAELGASLGVEQKLAEVRSFLERQRDEALRRIEEELGPGIKAARQVLGVVESKRDDVLKLVRAFGEPPKVSGLEFDRPEVAFFYHEIQDRVDVTPVIARAAQAAAIVDALKPFGIDLPVKQLGEQLIPEELRNFDLSSILPNIAGVPLQNLFSGLKMPEGSGDAVKVRHGVDPQTRRAWVNTQVNFQAKENATLFAVGPLAVRINTPRFEAEARMEADLHGIQQRKVRGQLSGDWLLQIGGFPLITFKQTPLDFDDAGRVNFRVNPKDVVLAPALDFINSLMTTISPGGLTTRFDGDGVVSTLDLPIPDTQIGAFGFSGLRLGASLALRFGGDFNIGVTASLGRHDAPFTLTIFILGGAGYLELGSRYYPSTGAVAATADMAIAASASLAIALGPIRGGVAVYVGVTAHYDSLQGGGLVVGLMFMVRGYVSVLSIASATITLRLDGQYQGGAMVGRGHLEIKIKICWCFTLEVSESVTYTLGRAGSGNQNAWLGGPQPVAQIASLDGPAAGAAAPTDSDPFKPALLTKAVDAYLNMLA